MLIIGVNSDQSVKRLKGDSCPINSQEDRAILLEALEMVDYITIFDEDTPLDLIRKIKPDYYTKGGDYNYDNVIGPDIGKEVVEEYGGNVVLIEYVVGYSTSKILQRNG